jgi:hypothetical protein
MATVRWIGNAQDVRQITTIAVADIWATGDEASLTINGKTHTLTLGTDVATTDVAAELKLAWNAASATADLGGATPDESRNVGGQEIHEFREIVATVSGSTLTLTGLPGVPFTVTASEVTAGDGTLGSPTTTQAATGKHFFNNTDNWEGGSLPSAGDTILFDFPASDVKYALNNTTEDLSLVREDTCTNNIGLPQINPLGYVEYRQRFLDLPTTATTGVQNHRIGSPSNSATTLAGFTYIDLGTNTGTTQTLIVNAAPAVNATNREAVQVVGGTKLDVDVFLGSVSLGAHAGENATIINSLETLYDSSSTDDSYVRIGSNASFVNVTNTIMHRFGALDLEANCNGTSNEVFFYGGTLKVAPGVTIKTLYGYGGVCDFRGSGVSGAAVQLHDTAILTLERAAGSVVFTNGFLIDSPNAKFKDPHYKGGTAAIVGCYGCSIEQVVETRPNLIWTTSSSGAYTPV